MNKNIFLIDLSESNRTQFGHINFLNQLEEQKIFSAIWELESQVNNGGFLKLLESTELSILSYITDALKEIGAFQCADILDKVLTLIPLVDFSEERTLRQTILTNIDDTSKKVLYRLEQDFFLYPDNLTDLLYDYVKTHPNVFGKTPTPNETI